MRRTQSLVVEEGVIQISINDADATALEDVPGIGPVLAGRIVEYRETHGRFKQLVDLKNVRGIGDKIFQQITPYIRL
jgi:competence protein ComEA